MGVISTLTVDLRANAAKFKDAMQKAQKTASSFGSELRANLNKAFKRMGQAVAGAVAALGAVILKTAAATREIRNLALVAGESVTNFQKMAHGARTYGIEQDKLADILKDTNDKIGDFMQTGGGAMADFFEQIAPKVGITTKAFEGLSGSQALQLYYDSLKKANVSQAEMTFYLEAIASDAKLLEPLLKNNGQGFKDMALEAERLGLVLSDIEVAKIENMSRSMDRAQGIFKGLGNQLTERFAPVITHILNGLTDWAVKTNFVGRVADGVFKFVTEGAKLVADAINGWKVIFHGVIVAFNGFKAAFATGMNFLVNDVIVEFGKRIQSSVLWPVKKAAELMAPFSAKAREALQVINELSEPKRIGILDELQNNAMNSLNDSIAKFKAAVMAEVPSVAMEKAFQEIELKAQQAAQNVANNGLLSTDNGTFAGDGTGMTEEEKGKKEVEERKKTIDKIIALEKSKNAALQKVGQAAMLAQKVMATKEALIAGKTAIAKAWASAPFPGNLLAVSMATAAAAANVAAIQGVAHGGLNNVPREGTFLLDEGERVLSPGQNKDLTSFLARSGGAAVSGSPTPSIENKIEPSVVVVDNEEKMFEALGSSGAAEIHIAQIERNRSRYRQALGV